MPLLFAVFFAYGPLVELLPTIRGVVKLHRLGEAKPLSASASA
jgi:hypothetical protein